MDTCTAAFQFVAGIAVTMKDWNKPVNWIYHVQVAIITTTNGILAVFSPLSQGDVKLVKF